MFPKTFYVSLAVLALVTMACGITIDLPVSNLKVGETVIEEISVPLPDASQTSTRLTLSFGAGELLISPGASGALVQGRATYNVRDLKPEITTGTDEVLIETGDLELTGFPNFGDDMENTWDLKLGSVPMDLTLNAGAYKGEVDLGGLSIQSLRVSDGAAEVNLGFSAPNLVEMDTLRYSTGASKVELTGLANANFDSMTFKGGAGNYTLDFSGVLKRDATVTVDSGFSSVTVVVPEGVSARVFVDSGLANVDIGGQWEKSGDQYTLAGEGPRLTLNINIGAGSLTLRNR